MAENNLTEFLANWRREISQGRGQRNQEDNGRVSSGADEEEERELSHLGPGTKRSSEETGRASDEESYCVASKRQESSREQDIPLFVLAGSGEAPLSTNAQWMLQQTVGHQCKSVSGSSAGKEEPSAGPTHSDRLVDTLIADLVSAALSGTAHYYLTIK